MIKWLRVWKKERKSETKIWNELCKLQRLLWSRKLPMEPWGIGTHIIPHRLPGHKLNALTPFVASIYLRTCCKKTCTQIDTSKNQNLCGAWCSTILFTHILHANTQTHNLMVSSDITISHFKEFSSEHSCVRYLKHPPKVSSHTHTLYTLTHTDTHTVLHLSRNALIGPSEEPLRRRVRNYRTRERERQVFPLFWGHI